MCIFSVRTLLSSWNFTTFHDFLYDLFKFSKTMGSTVSFKNTKTLPCFRLFVTFNSSTGTNSGVHQSACRLRCLITLLCLYIVLALSSAVTNLSNKTLIFHYFQWPTIKFHDFPGPEMKFLNSITFQVFHFPFSWIFHANKFILNILFLQSKFKFSQAWRYRKQSLRNKNRNNKSLGVAISIFRAWGLKKMKISNIYNEPFFWAVAPVVTAVLLESQWIWTWV